MYNSLLSSLYHIQFGFHTNQADRVPNDRGSSNHGYKCAASTAEFNIGVFC